ncbi:GNAT family N-acetyltransferase [Fulvivirgaceae bacterium BMA10]|uniref:GNAT family N-acetyltransferase n=1 Tax=Splendidivirga corallicola TaxID=3051826 RepID=A0ABT8KT67_9BACT|nr:GNAT family N-acetyltransferase [Fulvivirgaceae bacterium BMA10]
MTITSNIEFLDCTPPVGYKHRYESYLYNQEEFINLRSGYNIKRYFIVDHKTKGVLGSVKFFVDNGYAKSLVRTPFGGIELNSGIDLEILYDFVTFFESNLFDLRVNTITIKNAASGYDHLTSSKVTTCLLNKDYEIYSSEVNHHIEVNKTGLDERIHLMEERKLLKAKELNFRFEQRALKDLEEIYDYIKACRLERGITISMTYEELESTVTKLPDQYKIFTVQSDSEIRAATIAVRVNDRILYNFYPANKLKDRTLSPIVFLMEGIYNYCQVHGYDILDLGISSENNTPQFSLIKFKERMGGIFSTKFSFIKKRS